MEAIAEVACNNGSANATSFWSGHEPANAFIVGNKDAFWLSGSDAKYKGVFPKMIWYDFSDGNGFIPARITFQGLQSCKPTECTQFTPSIWEFVGSNDDVCGKISDWTILCQDYSGVRPRNHWAIKRCDVKVREEKTYRCLGINILGNDEAYSYVSNIRIWEKV